MGASASRTCTGLSISLGLEEAGEPSQVMRDVFDMVDKDRTGKVPRQAFVDALVNDPVVKRYLATPVIANRRNVPTYEHVFRDVAAEGPTSIDTNDDGVVDFQEFRRLFAKMQAVALDVSSEHLGWMNDVYVELLEKQKGGARRAKSVDRADFVYACRHHSGIHAILDRQIPNAEHGQTYNDLFETIARNQDRTLSWQQVISSIADVQSWPESHMPPKPDAAGAGGTSSTSSSSSSNTK
eukprot:TRINITY_DN88267_c0_g1_i1.p1 TRINITY_DN88267_c0_g1~~TRINITY_DN88267_c0_g1_i1.p1  ORF type:complete len:254 (-),score=99.91 TRINITY_DN88267_c0_g1_i1:83-799(-)